jgi:hypothetical protein
MKKVIVGLLVGMFVSTSAFAWGPREQGILTGAAGLWIVQQLSRPNQTVHVNGNPVVINPQPVYQQSPPIIVGPQPQQYCEYTVVTDQFGIQRSVPYCYFR